MRRVVRSLESNAYNCRERMPFTPAPSAAARRASGTSRGLQPPLAARPVTNLYAAPAPTAKSPLADELAKAAISPPGEKPKAMASNTMPKCKYGLACRIIDPVVECTANRPIAEQHWAKFQHPCYLICEEGHPGLGPPGML